MADRDDTNSGAVYLTDNWRVLYTGKVNFRGRTIYAIVTKHTDRSGTDRVTLWSQAGLMFRNERKTGSQPDVRGNKITLEGEPECEIAGWFFDAKENSSAGVSLRITPPEQRQNRQGQSSGGSSGGGANDDAWGGGGSSGGGDGGQAKADPPASDDEIPF